jgi:hypothetical protein
VRDFAAAGAVADVDRVVQVEVSGDRGKVVGVVVHVVAAGLRTYNETVTRGLRGLSG